MSNDSRPLKVGKLNTIIGNVQLPKNLGDMNTIIGPTDSRGNTIINQPGAIGFGASAGPGSIAIGAFANAGGPENKLALLALLINELGEAIERGQDPAAITTFNEIVKCVQEGHEKKKPRIFELLDHLKTLASLNGLLGLIERIGAVLN